MLDGVGAFLVAVTVVGLSCVDVVLEGGRGDGGDGGGIAVSEAVFVVNMLVDAVTLLKHDRGRCFRSQLR